MLRAALAVLSASLTLLPAQQIDSTAPDLATLRAWFDAQPDVPGPLRLAVIVQGDREPVVLTRGALDAAGGVRADGRSWVPLGGASQLALHELVGLEVDGGLELDASLRSTAPRLAVRLDEALQRVTWQELLDGESVCATYARWIRPGQRARPLDDVLEAHIFPRVHGSTWRSGDAEPLLLQLAVQERRGADWSELVRDVVAQQWGNIELRPRRPGGAALCVTWRDGVPGEGSAEREVPSCGGLQVRLQAIPTLLRVLGGPPRGGARWRDRTVDGERVGRRFDGSLGAVDVEILRYDGARDVTALLFCAGDMPGLDSSWTYAARRRLEGDLGVQEVETGGRWNSAVGLGGGAGGRFGGRVLPPTLDSGFVGSWRAELPSLDGSGTGLLELSVQDTDPEGARLWLDDRPVSVRSWGRDAELNVRGGLGAAGTVVLALQPDGDRLRGEAVVQTAIDDSLPWRIEFAASDEARAWPPWLPRVVAQADLPQRVLQLQRETQRGGGIFAVTNAQGWRWLRSYGHADAAGRVPMRRDMLIPLGSLSRTVSALAAQEILFDPEVELWFDTRLREVWGERPPELPDALGRLTLGALLHNEVLPEFELRLDGEAAEPDLSRLLATHGFVRPSWVRGSAHDDLSVGLLAEALARANGYRSWAGELAGGFGRETFHEIRGPGGVGRDAVDLQRIGSDGTVRSWPRGVLPGVGELWGLPIDVLRLGEITLWQLASTDDRDGRVDVLRCEEIDDGASRGFEGLLWEDRRDGVYRRMTVWPELEIAVFGFANHGDGAPLRALEQVVLDGYEQGGAFSSASFDEISGAFEELGDYRATTEAAGETIDWTLRVQSESVGDFGLVYTSVKAAVDGRERKVRIQHQDAERLVGTVDRGDLGELAFAVETGWFGDDLSGIVLVRAADGSRRPYPLKLVRHDD